MIDKPGIYDISDEEYHNDPCITPSASCSILELIDTRSAAHAYQAHPRFIEPDPEDEDTNTKFDLGHAFHDMMLGNLESKITVVHEKDWRTKAAKEERQAIISSGRFPILVKNYRDLIGMVTALKVYMVGMDIPQSQSLNEQTLVWKEGDNFFRIKPDCMFPDSDVILDYKATATSAAPQSWGQHLYRMGYDFRASFYARGYEVVYGRPLKEYLFLACETEKPYACTMFCLTPAAVNFASKNVDRAIDKWNKCIKTGAWPSYPSSTVYVNPPSYVEKKQIEREIAEQDL